MTGSVADIARSWVGTPYVHQASCKGAGCDCLGLLRGVWRSLHGDEPEQVPAYTPDWSEPSREERLWAAAARNLVEKSRDATLQSGDIVLFRMRKDAVAKHLGIVGSTDPVTTFIHAYSGHGVVESPFSQAWRRRVAAVFTFPEGPF